VNTVAPRLAMTTVRTARHLSSTHAAYPAHLANPAHASAAGAPVLLLLLLVVFVAVMIRATKSMGAVMSVLMTEMRHVAAAMASTMLGVVLAIVVGVALLVHH
jgi:hypothetical protein